VDWSHSGKLDLVSGAGGGGIWLFRNTGTRQNPVLAAGVKVEAHGKPIAGCAGDDSHIHVADWDGDGLRDLLVGRWTALLFYKNVGTPSEPRFAAPTEIKCPVGEFPGRPTPCVADLDGDGKPGLILGSVELPILFCRNIGTAQNPRLGPPQPLALKGDHFDEGWRYAVTVTDWNGDGKPDLLVGAGGNVWLFLGK
jgi:hypothetical protein